MSTDNAGHITVEYWATCLVCHKRATAENWGIQGMHVPGWTCFGRGRWHCPDCARQAVVVACQARSQGGEGKA